jgi:23S rRNA pseudouridine2605 synthase
MSGDGVRLQKFLSRAGVASRRASEELIREGRVSVDGDVVTEMGVRVDPSRSVVEVDGARVERSPARWIAFHKPPGVLSTRSDPRGRPTVYDHLPDGRLQELFHVGRLDYMSEGLLLLTNEGDVAHRVLHPSNQVRRRYEVSLLPPVPRDVARRLLEGVELEDGPATAEAAALLPPDEGEGGTLLLTLTEGRNREIRRMLEILEVGIRSLRRVAFGPVELGGLEPGDWRSLTEQEIERLRSIGEEG